jgi:metallo-beta-lactamase family protein
MCDAGRIRHHLKNNLWRTRATVLFVGYQAPGTLGRLILDGEKSVRIHGQEIAVKARIREMGSYSAHADQKELVAWVGERLPVHGGIFLVHGEDRARTALREHLMAAGCDGAKVHLPKLDDGFALAAMPPARAARRARIPDKAIARDWHNDYAALLLRLRRELERLPSDRARSDLLRRLHAELPASE